MATRDYLTGTGKLTIHWDSSLCYHAAACVSAEPGVFDPKRRPWIKTDEADDDAIAAAIDACPSGALSYSRAGAVTD
ncbi:MAG: (4Fe-4S)-binding protein, partial [Actinomycetota bacterium]